MVRRESIELRRYVCLCSSGGGFARYDRLVVVNVVVERARTLVREARVGKQSVE